MTQLTQVRIKNNLLLLRKMSGTFRSFMFVYGLKIIKYFNKE